MSRINEYVRTLPGVARRQIEQVFGGGTQEGEASVTIRSSGSIDTSSISRMSVVSPNRINSLFTAVAKKNKDAWETVDEVDQYVRYISERCNSVISSSARSIEKSRAMLNGIFFSAGRRESIDNLYTETFSGTEGTDSALTTAAIESGRLVLAPRFTNVATGRWSIRESHPVNSTSSINPSTGEVSVNATMPVDAARNDHLLTTIAYVMDAPAPVTRIVLNVNALTVKTVRVQNASGDTIVIQVGRRVDTTDAVIVSIPRMSVSGIEVDLTQNHYTVRSTTTSVSDSAIISRMRLIFQNAQLGSDMNIVGLSSAREMIERILQYQREHYDEMLWLRQMIGQFRRFATVIPGNPIYTVKSEALFEVSTQSIQVLDEIRETNSQWVSAPITIDGDARKLSLSVNQLDDEDVNATWYLSVEGRPWIPIVPENVREVTGEVLTRDFAGIATLKYPADPNSPIYVHGTPEDADVKPFGPDARSYNAVIIDKTNGGAVTIDYTTAFSGIVRLDEIGQSTGGVRVVDAMTDGQLGEHFTIITNSVTLKNAPHGEPDVYLDGVLATPIPDDIWFTDPSLSSDGSKVYYKIIGKTIFVNGEIKNVSVYYKYARTSIRLKALLESSSAESGKTPMIDSVTVGIKTMSV